MELWHWTLAAGDVHAAAADSPASMEALQVLDGAIELDVGTETLVLDAGTSVIFEASQAHAYRNPTRRSASFSLTVFDPTARSTCPPSSLLGAAMVFGAADFTGGYATRRTPVATVTLITNVIGVMFAAALVLALGGAWTIGAVSWSAVGGMCGLAGLLLLYVGLATGPNHLVSPLSAVVAAMIPVLVGIATGDRPDQLAIIGLLLAPIAIWAVAGGDHRDLPGAGRSLWFAMGAGVGFGLFFTCLAQTPDGAGAVPLLAARLTSTGLLLIAATYRRPSLPGAHDLLLPAIAGGLDMSANGLFLWSTRGGDLAVVGALVSLFPVTTILLALVVLHERLTRSQAAGMAVAIGSAALLS